MVHAIIAADFESWRGKARELLQNGTPPAEVLWREETGVQEALLTGAGSAIGPPERITVPRSFLERASTVARHDDPDRWALLYRIAYRLTHGEKNLLALETDEDTRAFLQMEKAVRALDRPSARALIPPQPTVPGLRHAIQRCEGCELFHRATQVVFGEGPPDARTVLVGEQPGDQEDLQGRPFVGPAGKLLDQALVEAGIRRSEVYITNAVKHFKFIERGKRRLHQTPTSLEVNACRPWLEAEILAVQPDIIVCLGATAAQCLLGRICRVTVERGRFLQHPWARCLTVTVHPSALLRIPEADRQQEEYELLVRDLRRVRVKLDELRVAHHPAAESGAERG